jgi:hypothetical protein
MQGCGPCELDIGKSDSKRVTMIDIENKEIIPFQEKDSRRVLKTTSIEGTSLCSISLKAIIINNIEVLGAQGNRY